MEEKKEDVISCKYEGCNNPVKHKQKQLCGAHYQMEMKGKTEETSGYAIRVCAHCNIKFKPNAASQIYCKDCWRWNRNRINRERRKKEEVAKICICCNESFTTARSKQKACSNCTKKNKSNTSKEYYKNVLKPKFGYLDRGDSYPQKFIYEVIKENFSNLKWEYDDRSVLKNPETNHNLELDIFCLDKKVAIEYDGEQHFSGKIYGEEVFQYIKHLDEIKNKLCTEKGIKLLRISDANDWKDKEWIIKSVGELLNVNNQIR
jgi:hypothetical protein